MTQKNILVSVKGSVAVLTIDRPEALNALDIPTLEEFSEEFTNLERDDAVNSRRGLAHYLEFAEVIHRVFRQVEVCDKPTICAVNGWALGGGVELLLATDIRVAAENAVLGLPEITLGLIPGAGGTQRLMRQIAPCKAREIMFTGDRISAEEAEKIGLINRVVKSDQLMADVMKTADRIANHSPLVLKLMKRNLAHGQDMSLPAALAHEQTMTGIVLATDDAHEGCSAFLEKRKAKFLGK